jgi:hypothetical protein
VDKNIVKKISFIILIVLCGFQLVAQQNPAENTITAGCGDTLWKYVKQHNSIEHWDTLKGYCVTLTGTVCCHLGVDGFGNDCDSTFNLYIKNNPKAQEILRNVIKENPGIPPCIETSDIHIEIICAVNGCNGHCKGIKYPGNHVVPAQGDSVSVTGRLIIDKNLKCEFEIHPAWDIMIYGKASARVPQCCQFVLGDCPSLMKKCKAIKNKTSRKNKK